jgi:serine/threonine protein kinase
MTQTPGTPAFMPPEVMVADPKYNTSVDMFSYGIMMIHMFSGQWPEPQVAQTRIEGGKLIPVSEIERRMKFFEAIEDGHPLMEFIHRCINNDPQLRPHAGDIIRRVSLAPIQFPASFANRLEMLRRIKAVEEEKRSLIEEGERKDNVIQEKEREIISLTEEGERKDNIIQEKEREIISLNPEVNANHEHTESAEIDRFKLLYSSEIEQLRLKIRDMNTQSQLTKDETKAEIIELESKEKRKDSELEAKSRALGEKDKTISELNEQITKTREYLATKQQVSAYTISDYL